MTLPNRMMPTGNFKPKTKKNFFDKLMYSMYKQIIFSVYSNKPITKPSNISKSHIIQPPTTRFQEAANSLNKTKHLRLLSSTQQVQVSLDHDYCSSLAKLKRGHHHHQHHHHGQHHRPNHHIISASSTSMASPRPLIRVQPSGSNTTVVTKPSSIVGKRKDSNNHGHQGGRAREIACNIKLTVVFFFFFSQKSI